MNIKTDFYSMEEKDLKVLARFVKKTSSFKPEESPKKPEHQPSKKELGAKYKLNLKSLKMTED